MIIILNVEDLKHGIDFINAELEDFNIDPRLIFMAHVIKFVNDKGDVIKVFKNRFGVTK